MQEKSAETAIKAKACNFDTIVSFLVFANYKVLLKGNKNLLLPRSWLQCLLTRYDIKKLIAAQ
jgi:hypothetical protein